MAADRKTELDIEDIETPPQIEAPEVAPEPEAESEEIAPKKAKKKIQLGYKLLFIVFGVFFVSIFAFGIVYQKMNPPKEATKEIKKDEGASEVLKEPINFKTYLIGTFFFPLDIADKKEEIFFKISISAKYDDEAVFKEFMEQKKHFNVKLYKFLKGRKFDDLYGKEKQDKLNEEVLALLNSMFTKGEVERILFTEYFLM